jgi:hypothetical protein
MRIRTRQKVEYGLDRRRYGLAGCGDHREPDGHRRIEPGHPAGDSTSDSASSLSAAVLGERPSGWQLAGCALVPASVLPARR